jgi:hypothetical protein
MSDKFQERLFSGNFKDPTMDAFQSDPFPGKRRLVEECELVSVFALQRFFGKKTLLSKIRAAEPFLLPVSGGNFEVWFIFENHRLPGNQVIYASLEDGTSRIWLACPGCRRPVAKLFFYYVGPGTSGLSNLRCRRCHELTYLSANCGKNRWYREVARPLKRLHRRRECVERWIETPRRDRFLAIIDRKIAEFTSSASREKRARSLHPAPKISRGRRRPYKDIRLLF